MISCPSKETTSSRAVCDNSEDAWAWQTAQHTGRTGWATKQAPWRLRATETVLHLPALSCWRESQAEVILLSNKLQVRELIDKEMMNTSFPAPSHLPSQPSARTTLSLLPLGPFPLSPGLSPAPPATPHSAQDCQRHHGLTRLLTLTPTCPFRLITFVLLVYPVTFNHYQAPQ